MSQASPSRLERACSDAKSLREAADNVVNLYMVIWEECETSTEYPGSIYGDKLEEAGFAPGDRFELAQFPYATATRIAQHHWSPPT